MARVFIPTLLRELTAGMGEVDAPGASVRQVLDALDARFPGLAARLSEGGRLRPNVSVAVDGEITPLGLLEQVGAESEVHFITAIKGGSGASAGELTYATNSPGKTDCRTRRCRTPEATDR